MSTFLLFLLAPSILLAKTSKPPSTQAPSPPSSKVVDISFLPESSIRIDGDSTARKYSAIASSIDLKGKVKAIPASTSTLPWAPLEMEMVLPVKNLNSGERTLDKHMQENLKAEQYPEIQMKLSAFTFGDKGNDVTGITKAAGTLTVAGVTKPIELDPIVTTEGQNIRIKGKKRVLMSNFGIKPPTLMMGTLKTRDEIDINYDVICSINDKQRTGK